ncbi:MAG: heme exporter protein CcmB [Anaerolineae bacterium]|nr:heme exporter protein CcmB [Anaerolineae bacterium]
MSSAWQAVWAIVKKDILAELRTKETLSMMLIFVLLAVFIFNFAFDLRVENVREVAPGVMWVAFVFAGVLGLNRSFIQEADKGCLDSLLMTPVERSVIYFGKMLGNLIFMLVVDAIALPVFSVLLNLALVRWDIALIVALGTLGFAGVGTLFSAMTANTRAREVMLPLLLFPVALPLVLAAVKATAGVLDGAGLREVANWLNLLIGYDVAFLTISYLTFDYVVES